ncbi:MAG: Trm112 family protein [Gammaproteobacteria bacterium]|nr:Trm112 family protein [Gammaproteobacteria bacterium]
MSLDQKLLSILVCPVCKGELKYDKSTAELVCTLDGLAYPIEDDIPVMLSDKARKLDSQEREKYR